MANVRVQNILMFLLIAGVLFVFSSISAAQNMGAFTVLLIPTTVAIYAGRGQINQALGLVAVCGLGALSAGRSMGGALQYALIAMAGMPIAVGVVRRWTYGKTLTAVAATASVAVIGGMLANWSDWLTLAQTSWDTVLKMMQMGNGGDMPPEMLDRLQWMRASLPALSVGMQFVQVVAASCVAVWLALRDLRLRHGVTGVQGSFRTARVSEWLVWAVIAVAGLWFADQQWPSAGLKVIAWNGAIALAFIYWLNGLSVVLYGLDVLSPGFFGYTLVVLLMVSCGIYPVCLIGLFDTWGNFRSLFDRIAAERKRREQTEHADDQ